MRIGLDATGGDFAPETTIAGAQLAIDELPHQTAFVLLGEKDLVTKELDKQEINTGLFELVDAPEMIGMGEHPTKALTTKPNSAIAHGFGHCKDKRDKCLLHNTGAMHVGAIFTIKAIEGIIRPGISGFVHRGP